MNTIHHMTDFDRRRIEKILLAEPLGAAKDTRHTSQTTFRHVALGETGLEAIVKPEMAPDHNAGANTGVAKREAAAYDMAKALGLPLVPPTVLRTWTGMIVSAQLEVPGAADGGDLALVDPAEVRAAAALDVLMDPADRLGNNWMTYDCAECSSHHLLLIDNSWCFDWVPPSPDTEFDPLGSDLVSYAVDNLGGPDPAVLRSAVDSATLRTSLLRSLDDAALVDRVIGRASEALAA